MSFIVVSRLESTPHPSMFGTGPEKGMFEHLAPEVILLCNGIILLIHYLHLPAGLGW